MITDSLHITKRKNSVSTLLAEDILHVRFSPNTVLEAIDFQEGKEDYLMLGEGRALKHLIEFGAFSTATKEAREWAELNSPAAIAEALVIHSLSQRILVRFYLMLKKNTHRGRVFDNKEDAMKWLNDF